MTDPSKASNPSIVITGMGLVSAAGLDRAANWRTIQAGRGGIGELTALEQTSTTIKNGGQAPPLNDDHDPVAASAPREIRYLRHAIREALSEVGLADASGCEPHRCSVVFGTTLHGMRAAGQYFRSDDPHTMRHFQAAAVIEQAIADLPIRGQTVTTCSACSSGLSSIGLAMTLLQSGELDLVLAGGYDTISEYAYGGFNALRLIAAGSMRPFCRDREGMKLGEGYGVLVLERADDAAKRNPANTWPILGLGESADAHHLTQPHPQGDGAVRAMALALRRAGIEPDLIDLLVAHATCTPSNDRSEAAAMIRVFADRLAELPVVAFMPQLGHTLGGAGLIVEEHLTERCGAILGTAHGSSAYSANYYRQIIDEGIDWGNAMLFAEGVPNAGAAHLSLMLGLKGPCQSIIGSRTAGLDALRLASLRIASGQWNRAIVSTAEESTDIVRRAYRHCQLHTADDQGGAPLEPAGGFIMSPGAATIVLESAEAAEARGAHIRAVVEHTAAAVVQPQSHPREAVKMMRQIFEQLGEFDHAITSSNSTWLGKLEVAGLQCAADGECVLSSLYGHIGETFSVMPMAALTAVSLTGRLPRLHGQLPPPSGRLVAADGTERPQRLSVSVIDPHGPVVAAVVRLTSEKA